MRTSKKARILDAAISLINREGVHAVTYEAVANESGLTRGGLLYHFPSREDLLRGIDERLVETWRNSMEAILGKPAEAATPYERHQAFAEISAKNATRAEVMFMLESAAESGKRPAWVEGLQYWAPKPPTTPDPADLDAFVARLAADGLWVYEVMNYGSLDASQKARIVGRIKELLSPDAAE